MGTVDLSEFDAIRKGPPCAVTVILNRLEVEHPDKAAKLRAVLPLPKEHYTHARIATVVTDWGYRIDQSTVGRHRLGRCRCGDE